MLQNIPHQIAHSPARLGLPNPNSPSIQNQNPQLSQNLQAHQPRNQPSSNQSTIPAVSSTLLPLLSPLPRAQSLLMQMASLCSKLFEVSPNRSHWISSYRGSLPTFLSPQTQQPSLSPSPSTSAKEVLDQFASLQDQMLKAVSELQEILDLQDSREKLTREIRSKDSALLSFAHKLKETEHVLDVLVDDYSDYRRPKRTKSGSDSDSDSSTTTIATHLKLSDILSYAHKISYTTFAPPEFGSGQAPLRGALPPAPQDEQMRASQLYNFANLDVGLPEDEGKEKMIEPLIEAHLPLPLVGKPIGDLSAIQGLMPPNIVVPSGWKPGMPVELPSDLPILPPPGWKPGDPIALPPLDSFGVFPPRVVEEQQQNNRPPPPLAAPPQVLGRAPEPIQVRHVQLDIEYDSSDYSSDEGSSDSED